MRASLKLIILTFVFVSPYARARAGEIIEGSLLSLKDRLQIVWVRGEHCGSSRMCEGILYSGAEVRLRSNSLVVIERLLLLSPETIDCKTWEPYWATQVVFEAFAPGRTGIILGHRYKRIDFSHLVAIELDLGAATDVRAGFAAAGTAFVGEIAFTVEFDSPFPEDLHLQSYCDEAVHGKVMINKKRVQFWRTLRQRERVPGQ